MKINSLLIGKGSGSAGNVTVTTLKGQTILKQKATIVSNPSTPLQQNTRKMMSRAVYAWQMIGNTVKAGWTSLLAYASQYNTYVSANAGHFAEATFTPGSFKFSDLNNSIATKGILGVLSYSITEIDANQVGLSFNKVNLNMVAKVGDRIILTGGGSSHSEGGYDEKIVTQALLDSASPSLTFDIGDVPADGPVTVSCYLVSADGKKSTTSQFLQAEV